MSFKPFVSDQLLINWYTDRDYSAVVVAWIPDGFTMQQGLDLRAEETSYRIVACHSNTHPGELNPRRIHTGLKPGSGSGGKFLGSVSLRMTKFCSALQTCL